jgi:hypothetical protein
MRRFARALGVVTVAGTVALTAVIACSDAKPVAPTPRLDVPDRDVAALHLAIDDIRERVIPTLGHSSLIGNLSHAVDALTLALDESDTTALRVAITQTDDALAALAAHPMSGRVADADLDVVWLVLVNARSMIASR